MDSWNESAAQDCMYPASTLTCDFKTGTERTWLRRWPTLSSAVQSAGLLRRYSNTSAFRKHPQRQQPHAATLVSFLHPIHLTHTAAPNIEHQAEISKNPQLTLSDEFSFNNKIKYISLLGKDLALRDLASLINHFPELHSSFIHRFLMEAYLFLSNPHFIHTVHIRLREHLHGTKPNIVIAHSIGSVIAYNYLIQHPELKIQTLITLGSPLCLSRYSVSFAATYSTARCFIRWLDQLLFRCWFSKCVSTKQKTVCFYSRHYQQANHHWYCSSSSDRRLFTPCRIH